MLCSQLSVHCVELTDAHAQSGGARSSVAAGSELKQTLNPSAALRRLGLEQNLATSAANRIFFTTPDICNKKDGTQRKNTRSFASFQTLGKSSQKPRSKHTKQQTCGSQQVRRETHARQKRSEHTIRRKQSDENTFKKK